MIKTFQHPQSSCYSCMLTVKVSPSVYQFCIGAACMSHSSGKIGRGRNTLRAIILLLTIGIQFVLSKMIAGGMEEVLLRQWSIISGKLPPGKYNRKEVTALAYKFPPLFDYKRLKEGNYSFEGSFFRHMEEIEAYLNMSLKYVILDETNVTKYGQNAAIVPYVVNKVVDIIPVATYQDESLISNKIEILAPIDISPFVILQPYPDEESHLDVTMRPFQLPVWLCVLASTAIFVFVSAIIIKYKMENYDSNSVRQSFGTALYNQLDYVIRNLTNQGSSGTHARTRTSFKIMTGFWLLAMVVLINGYAGVLSSLLTVPKMKPIAKIMKDVAESKELQVTCEKGQYFCDTFLNATEGHEKMLGDQLRNDPTLVVSDGFDAYRSVIDRKLAFPTFQTLVSYLLRDDTKRNGRCRLTSSPPLREYPSFPIQIQIPLGSPYAADYSEAVLRLWDNGMMNRLTVQLYKATDQCSVDKPLETRTRTLTLNDFSPAFAILGIGLSLSTFCFVVELILSKCLLIIQTQTRVKPYFK